MTARERSRNDVIREAIGLIRDEWEGTQSWACGDVAGLVAQLEALADGDAEAIICDLAAADLRVIAVTEPECSWCFVCGHDELHDGDRINDHETDCLIGRAREWVAQHPKAPEP